MAIDRAHFSRTLQTVTGAFAQGASVQLFEAGTRTPVSLTIYPEATGDETRNNPWTADDGRIDFYLDEKHDVDIEVTYGGEVILSQNVQVLPPARNLLVLDPADPYLTREQVSDLIAQLSGGGDSTGYDGGEI